jgi:purine-binding chemotaxis protein CheW
MSDPTSPPAVDWADIRARLDRAGTALEEALHPSPERARAVLEKRARDLACRPANQAASAAPRLLVVTFALAGERYALEARYVREVLRLTDCTPLPGAPAFVVGVLNLRGEVLAVFDLRPLLGLVSDAAAERGRILVLGVDRPEFGLLADAAEEVAALAEHDLHEPPDSVVGPGREYLRGVTQEALIVLDGAVLLRDGRLFVDQGEEGRA